MSIIRRFWWKKKVSPPEDPVLRIFQAIQDYNSAQTQPGVHSTEGPDRPPICSPTGSDAMCRLSEEVQWLKEKFGKVLERQQTLIATLRAATDPMQKVEERVETLEERVKALEKQVDILDRHNGRF